MKKLFLFCAVVLLFAATSCHKSIGQDEATPPETDQKASPVKFQINGKKVLESDFFTQLLPNQATLRDQDSEMSEIADKYRVLGEFGRTDADGNKYNIVNVFTDDNSYYEYADANGHTKEREIDAVMQDLADYAVSSGAIAECQATGNVSKDYVDYMDTHLVALGLQSNKAPEVQLRTLTNMVYKDCLNTGNSWPIRTNAWLGMFGFNNNISSYYPVGFTGGACLIYDKWFFSKRMITIWSWDLNVINFCGGPFGFVNDKATSWATAGIL